MHKWNWEIMECRSTRNIHININAVSPSSLEAKGVYVCVLVCFMMYDSRSRQNSGGCCCKIWDAGDWRTEWRYIYI